MATLLAHEADRVIQDSLGFTRSEPERPAVSAHAAPRGDLPPVAGDRVRRQQVLSNRSLNGAGVTVRFALPVAPGGA